MAESDPVTTRPFGQPAGPAGWRSGTDEDPLVELARIVSEDSGFGRPEPQRPQRDENLDRKALSADLEAELLQELETTLTPRGSGSRSAATVRSQPAAPVATTPVAGTKLNGAGRMPVPSGQALAPQRRDAPAAVPSGAMPASDSGRPVASHDSSDDESSAGEGWREVPEPESARDDRSRPAGELNEGMNGPARNDSEAILRSIEEQLGAFERRAQAAWDRSTRRPAAAEGGSALRAAMAAVDRAEADSDASEPGARLSAREHEDEQPVERRPSYRDTYEPRISSARSAGPPPEADPRDAGAEAVTPPRDAVAALRRRDLPRQPLPERSPEPVPGRAPIRPFGQPPVFNLDRDQPSNGESAAEPARSGAVPGVGAAAAGSRFGDGANDDVRAVRRHGVEEAGVAREVARGAPSPSQPGFKQTAAGLTLPPAASAAREPAPVIGAVQPSAERGGPPVPPRTGSRYGPRRNSRRGLRAALYAASALVVIAIAGASALRFWPGEGATDTASPPVIAADTGAVKVAPQADGAASGENAGDAVYNRVAGATPETSETVVEGAEEPKEISRIVLPPPQANSDALVKPVGQGASGDPATTGATAGTGSVARQDAADTEIGARRVRTFSVKPDGSISASATPQPKVVAAAPAAEPVARATEVDPVPVRTTSIDGTAAANPASEANEPRLQEPPAQPSTAAGSGEPGVAAEPAAAELAPAEPAPVRQAAVAPSATPSAGGFVVQVSSQRSEAEARSSLSALQRQYASVLDGLPSDVVSADLGAKGVYFRARVGAYGTRAEAAATCERLKAAGASCLVAAR